MKTIVICSSFAFYKHVIELEKELTQVGYTAVIPATATAMKTTADFTKDPLRDKGSNHLNIAQKTKAIQEHFNEIKKADAILVVNDQKHDQPNYIGPNVLMEMAVAFARSRPIYLLNSIPEASPLVDEIKGLEPRSLNGDLRGIAI